MEEFIEKFSEFREYLNKYETDETSEGTIVLEDLKYKFDLLGLNDVF